MKTHSSFLGDGPNGETLHFQIRNSRLTKDGNPTTKAEAKAAVWRLWDEVVRRAEAKGSDYPGKRYTERHPVECGLIASIEECDGD